MNVLSKLTILLVIVFLGYVQPCKSQNLDRYGGRKDIRCTNASRSWHTEKIQHRWWICTPDGFAMFAQAVDTIITLDSVAQKVANSKYGSSAAWSEATLQRLSAWGFNVIGSY